MCLTFFCIQPKSNPLVKFVLGFNREEQTVRKTLTFQPFQQDKNIYGGRDLVSGGTWLGINIQTGLLVFLTNYDLIQTRIGLSRGQLVYRFLKTDFIPKENRNQTDLILQKEMIQIAKMSLQYTAFNLTVCNLRTRRTFYICSQRNPGYNSLVQLAHGVPHGISNSDILQVWPKTALCLSLFSKIIEQLGQINEQQVFQKIKQVCQNKQRFSQIDDDQSSIFVLPYHCQLQQQQRRTKSTFMLLMLQREDKYELVLKEITYKGQDMQEEEILYNIFMQK